MLLFHGQTLLLGILLLLLLHRITALLVADHLDLLLFAAEDIGYLKHLTTLIMLIGLFEFEILGSHQCGADLFGRLEVFENQQVRILLQVLIGHRVWRDNVELLLLL